MGQLNKINSLCHILRQKEDVRTDGIGIFIARNAVLTAAHVVDDAKLIEVTNAKGEKTTSISDIFYGTQHDGTEIDAAVLLLETPIGRSTCQVAREAPIFSGKTNPESRLITIFNGNKSQHTVSLCPDFHSARGTARFYSNLNIEPGYSGSPILDKRDRIISLATGMYGSNFALEDKGKPFFGLQPNALLSFLSQIKEKSNRRIDLEL